MIKLSIIIPAYNAESYIYELLDCLNPQITKETEVIVVDDGSDKSFKTDYKWVKVIRQQKNRGLSFARNKGLDVATGEYIAFIDADDLVSDTYISQIFSKMPFDYVEMSWKTLAGGENWSRKLNSKSDYLDNCSVWSRVYSRKFIGDTRFNENKDAAEDEDFTRRLNCRGEHGFNRDVITDYLYFYRTSVEDSLYKKYMQGRCNTRRIVYYFPTISKEMTFLIDEVKEMDKFNEVWILTNKNELPELERYAQISTPFPIRGMELRGAYTKLFTKINIPIKAQVVLWTNKTFEIGGIETFIYNFCMTFKDEYEICVLYNQMDIKQINRLKPYVRVEQNNAQIPVYCDTLIVNRIIDSIPENIHADKTVQMVHTCKNLPDYHIPTENRDMSICVSKACRTSYKTEGDKSIIIQNIVPKIDVKRVLLLISATRLDTNEKGQKRMIKLAKELTENQIPYIWFYFSNAKLENAPPNMVCINPMLDIRDYIAKADFLVQLSDSEAFCYSIVESVMCGVPVICTDLPVLSEIGIKDGVNAHVLPMDLDVKYDVKKIYNNPLRGFEYEYDNDKIIKQWKKVLGKAKAKNNAYKYYREPLVKVRAVITYNDILLQRRVEEGEVIEVYMSRAYDLQQKKLVEMGY